jgi:hypothetical protein
MSNIKVILKKKAYDPSKDNKEGVIIFDNITNNIYLDGVCYGTKPVELWKALTINNGIIAAGTDNIENPEWQITKLDMSAFKTIKLYISGDDSTPPATIEIDLDNVNKGQFGYFYGSSSVYPYDNSDVIVTSAVISQGKSKVFFNKCIGLKKGDTKSNLVLYKIVGIL